MPGVLLIIQERVHMIAVSSLTSTAAKCIHTLCPLIDTEGGAKAWDLPA